MRTYWGALIGAAVFTLIPEISRGLKDYRGVFLGGLIIALMIIRPKGLMTRDIAKVFLRRHKEI
jgi:branched-chain amino acid transport system permease protein